MSPGVNRRLLLAVLLPLLSGSGFGCVPMRVWTVPEVSGRIHRGGSPVSDATVVWKTWEYREDKLVPQEAARARTNPNGEFEMKDVSSLTWGVLLPAHSTSEWELTLLTGAENRVLWHQWLYSAGPSSTPSRVRLTCDTALPRPCDLLEVEGSRLEPKRGLPVDKKP